MTDVDGTQDEQLYGAFGSAIGPEPPMRSLPADDLARGRRRLRHRRIGTAAGVAVAVPVVALMATVVPDNPSAGPDNSGFADDPGDESSLEAECPVVDPESKPSAVPGVESDSAPRADGGKAAPEELEPAPKAGHGDSGWVAYGSDVVVAGEGDCEVVPVIPVDPKELSELDRLDAALRDAVDPAGGHLTSSVAGAASGAVRAGDDDPGPETVSQASVGATWVDGTGEGAVTLSVIDPSVGDVTWRPDDESPCADPALMDGPRLACEWRRLPNGSMVFVGTGEQDGVERVTVRFTREDGEVVWATSDQASERWWVDGSGADPLEAPPATLEQLIDLVQDPRVHL